MSTVSFVIPVGQSLGGKTAEGFGPPFLAPPLLSSVELESRAELLLLSLLLRLALFAA